MKTIGVAKTWFLPRAPLRATAAVCALLATFLGIVGVGIAVQMENAAGTAAERIDILRTFASRTVPPGRAFGRTELRSVEQQLEIFPSAWQGQAARLLAELHGTESNRNRSPQRAYELYILAADNADVVALTHLATSKTVFGHTVPATTRIESAARLLGLSIVQMNGYALLLTSLSLTAFSFMVRISDLDRQEHDHIARTTKVAWLIAAVRAALRACLLWIIWSAVLVVWVPTASRGSPSTLLWGIGILLVLGMTIGWRRLRRQYGSTGAA